MDSSSDESFVWTKASTGSEDSDDIKNSIMNYDESEDENKIIINKSTKPEERDISNECKKPKKRKHKQDSDEVTEVMNSPKKKKIKTEPESESEARSRKKKKKKDREMSSEDVDELYNHEDEYLNMKIKKEREYHETSNHENSKKSKKQLDKLSASMDSHEISAEINGNHDTIQSPKKKKKHKIDIMEHEHSSYTTTNNIEQSTYSDEEKNETFMKTSKKKKRKESKTSQPEEFDDLPVDDQFEGGDNNVLEETKQVDEVFQVNGINSSHSDHYSDDNDETNSQQLDTIPNNIDEHRDNQNHNSDHDSMHSELSAHELKVKSPHKISPRKPRLSDRIKFEEEIESDAHSDSNNNNDDVTSNLKRFLRENSNLLPVSKNMNKGSEITTDDEIWILKCPHDVDVSKLNNSDINLDSKSKIKINGESYCGNLDDTIKINIMCSNKNDYKIKNLVPNGIIHFRKRLPKPHYHEDNVMVNNQTDFIPLPETKCRHPLFGINYKDVIHVPIERLNHSVDNGDLIINSKKKKKKKHKEIHEPCTDIKPKLEHESLLTYKKIPKEEIDAEVPVKKAKKRKLKHNDDSDRKKSKKMKLEPDSEEVWESEKAIEENLFNF